MSKNIFEQAIKKKVRFSSDRGQLTTEQLYDLSLTKLDTIARAVNKELKEIVDVSFIENTPDPRKNLLSLQLEILKTVISDKIAQRDAAASAEAKAQEKRKLLAILEDKENEELNKLSKDDIMKKIASLV